jgi:hypothetical protein
MNNSQPSSTAYREAVFVTQSKLEAPPKKNIADLLEDASAIADWNSNIEKIRQKESEAQSKTRLLGVA